MVTELNAAAQDSNIMYEQVSNFTNLGRYRYQFLRIKLLSETIGLDNKFQPVDIFTIVRNTHFYIVKTAHKTNQDQHRTVNR